MRLQRLQTQRVVWTSTRTGICKATRPLDCWGIASNVVSNNGLLILQELVITTLDSSNPTLHPTNNDISIADSGLAGFYFGPDALVNNHDATAPTIEVQVDNGTSVQSIASAELVVSVPDLPASTQTGHVMANSPHSLIGLAPFVDAGCQVLFTKTLVIAFDQDDKAILVGWRETTGPWLWRLPLLPQPLTSPSLAVKLQQLTTPCTHGTQLDAIKKNRNVITSVLTCPKTLLWQPTQNSA